MRTIFLWLGLMTSAILFGCSSSPNPETPQEIIILQMNDVYEISPLEGGAIGGLARVATLKKQLEAEAPVVTVLSGDFLSPSLIGTLRYEDKKIAGRQMVETLNALGLDYVTFGNHEFDLKEPDLLANMDASAFTWISTNTFHVTEQGTEAFTQNGTPLPKSVIHPIPLAQDTLRLLFTGHCLPFNNQEYVTYEGYNTTARAALQAASGQYHAAIAITHLNWVEDTTFAHQNPQYDMVLGGHDHEHMYIPVGPSFVAKADANAKTVYVHRLSYYPSADSVAVSSELVAITDSLADDPAVAAVVEKWNTIANEAMQQMGYTPDEKLMTATEPLDGRESSIRNFPTDLGELTCQSMANAEPSIDLALFNGGSIRLDDQLSGTITMYDVLRTYPYGGEVCYTLIPGHDLLKILDIGRVQNVGTGGYLQSFNLTQSADGTYLLKGEAIDPAKKYRVMVTDFLSKGLEANLEILGSYTYTTPKTFGDTRNDIRDVVATYMRQLQTYPPAE